MNPSDRFRLIALYFTGTVTLIGAATFAYCAIFRIYIDVPQLIVLQAITIGGLSSFTMLLTGRTIAQLNQGPDSETTTRQTTETVTKPKPSPDAPMVITKQPEVAIAGDNSVAEKPNPVEPPPVQST